MTSEWSRVKSDEWGKNDFEVLQLSASERDTIKIIIIIIVVIKSKQTLLIIRNHIIGLFRNRLLNKVAMLKPLRRRCDKVIVIQPFLVYILRHYR